LTPERWAQIEELFHRAAECDPKLRASLLDGACRGDEELRRVVEGLLASEESARDDMHAAVHSGLDGVMFPLIGETVSHYRISEGLGGGGMGLVYRAEDIKLGRLVALKFLPEESTNNPEALERFEREARSASTLEHPNICPVYEFGEHEGQPFIVMPLLEGLTLRDRLAIERDNPAGGAISLPQLLDVAIQTCKGLEAAHEKGIIHRDVKPANIFITDKGVVKILDFGLAKLAAAANESEELATGDAHQTRRESSCLPAVAHNLTHTGVAVGTGGYMSPEQVRGDNLDLRTDLFSFGVVLYEMTTGKRPFSGDTSEMIFDSILHRAPASPARLNPELPTELERIINKALEKDRHVRYQSVSEIRADLERFSEQVGEPRRSAGLPRTSEWTAHLLSTKRLVLLFSLLGLLVLGVTAKLLFSWRPPLPNVINSSQITRDGVLKALTLRLVSDGYRLFFQEGSWSDVEKKTALVQVSTQGGETARIPISLRNPVAYDLSQTRSELLLGAGEFVPSIERPLWVLPLPAGPPHRLGDVVAHDACWAPDGRQLVFANGKDISVAKADGSDVRKLATPDGFDFSSWIRFSPDGKRLRFTVLRNGRPPTETEVMEMAADGSGLHRLPLHGGCCGTWSADGRYYFYRKIRDTWVLPERHSVFGKAELGTPVQLTVGPINYGTPTPSANGKQLFVVGDQNRVELVHYASNSKQWVPFLGGISAGELEVSPDGQWVTYTTFPESDLWRSKLDGSERLQLTSAPIKAHEPRWSPDGKQILFTALRDKILVVPADGGAPRQLMPADHPDEIGAGAWLPDGNSIIFVRHMGCAPPDDSCFAIYRLDLKTQEVSKVPGSDGMFSARLSRDGHYLTAQQGNQNKVMLYDFRTNRWSQLIKGFGSIVWSRNSKFVYLDLKHEAKPAELVRVSVPDGKVQRMLDLTGVTLGGFWPDWISLLPDDSPLLMLDRSTQEIYRFDLQYR